jgi:hypothetical protein
MMQNHSDYKGFCVSLVSWFNSYLNSKPHTYCFKKRKKATVSLFFLEKLELNYQKMAEEGGVYSLPNSFLKIPFFEETISP